MSETVALGAGDGRRRWVSRAAWGTAPVVLAALAIVYPGAPVAQLDLHDGTVWLTNEAYLTLGRYNPAVEELNAGLIAERTPFDVLQDGFDVLLELPGSVAVVNPADVALGAQAAVGSGADVDMARGTTVVVRREDGAVRAVPTAMIGALRMDEEPDLDLGPGGAAVVARSGAAGTVLGVATDGTVQRLTVTADGATAADGGRLAGTPGGIDQVTAVGDEPVVLAGRTLYTRSAVVDLGGYQGELALQQPGPASGVVLVGVTGALLEVPLDGGDPRELPGGPGRPSSPVRVGDCAHGAWAATTGAYTRACRGADPEVEDLREVAATDDLVFRVNRDVVALNSVKDGRLWLPMVDADVREPNWTDVEEETEEDTQDEDQTAVTTETLQAECRPDSAPPSAVDDAFGVRPGQTLILPVVDNDASSSCGMLAITQFDDLEEDFGTLTSVYGGRALQLSVREGATGTADFTYTVTDGRGSAAPSTADVTLTVRDPGENGAPVQQRVGAIAVEQGGTATYDVLADFRDPDGDPMVLLSAVGTGGQARARGDGLLRFQADTTALGRQTVTVQVSDGTETTEGTVFVDIRPTGSMPPVLEPLHAVTYVDEPVTVDALSAVRSQGREMVRLAGVEEVVGLTLETDLERGEFTVVARAPGTYYVPFTVVAAPQQATGLARIDVLERPEVTPPPIAVRDVALLPPGGEVTIDPLANDTDPSGGVLVVQSVEAPAGSGLRVAVLEHRLLRITATRTLDAPLVVTYTVSNGEAATVGQVVVQPVPASAGQQPPVVPPMHATVRTGGVVTIPVLEGAFDPDGDPLTLERELLEAPASGLMFVSGDVLRFQAPATPGQVRATVEVTDPTGNATAAMVTIDVHTSDADGKAPPRPLDLTARVYAGETVTVEVPLVGIDDDGDGVTLLGIDTPPGKGRVLGVGSRTIEYEALPGELGLDTFSYAVEDWTGQRAVATVRVGIAPRPVGAVPVVTEDDAVSVRPGQTVEVRVLANDRDSGGGELFLDEALSVQPPDVDAHVDGRRVVVRAPQAPGTLQVLYTARNARGGQDTGLLTVTVSADARFLPPVATDIVVPAADTINKTSVVVEVLDTAQNPSGPLSDLAVDVDDSVRDVAVAPGDGTVVVTLVDRPQTLPYVLRNTNPAAGGISSYAFITVPALGDFPPQLRPGLDDLSVLAGESLRIELAERVRVAPGRSPRIGDPTRTVATKSDGSSLVVDEDTLLYTPRRDYAGPASISVLVSDGPLTDPTVHSSMMTFPIMVLAREEHPPTFTPSVLEVPQAASARVDLLAFTSAPASAGTEDATVYGFALAGGPPAGFDVQLSGSVLTVTAGMNALRGTVASIPLALDFGGADPLAVQVDVRVVASGEPLARVADVTIEAEEGTESSVAVLQGAFNPFDPQPLSVLSAVVETPGAGTARVSGSTVVVRPADGFIGVMVTRFTVRDALPDLDRVVEGRITAVVRGAPEAPGAPRVESTGDRSVVLSWDAPANNGEPIDSYRVTAAGVQQTCGGTTCTITGLTNNVTYTFTVAAHNEVGWSDPSPPSGEARPDTAPLAPAAPRVERGDGVLTVSWAPPENPGSPITEYQVSISPMAGGSPTITERGTSTTIRGLVNGQRYTVQVRALNSAIDPGPWSPEAYGTPARVPDAPASVTATRAHGLRWIEVRWTAPPSDGGEPVTGYEVSVDGSVAYTGPASALTWGFEARLGRTYAISVRAVNAVGRGAVRNTDGMVWGDPAPPTGLSAVDVAAPDTAWGQGRMTVSWEPPTDLGGEELRLSGYILSVDGTEVARPNAAARTATVTGLVGGEHTVTLVAVNSENATSAPATTTGVATTEPARPTVSIDPPLPRSVTVRWSAAGTGGTAITGWQWRTAETGWQTIDDPAQTTLTLTVEPDEVFSIQVRAVNARGVSDPTTAETRTPAEPDPDPEDPEEPSP